MGKMSKDIPRPLSLYYEADVPISFASICSDCPNTKGGL